MYAYDACIAVAVLLHVLVCPYTKVEESFNLQATHDILYHRTDIDKYDHLEFPGVVPRTFIGPICLAAISSPGVAVVEAFNLDKFVCQYVVRIALGLLLTFGLAYFRSAVETILGSHVSVSFAVVTLCQFHLLFYASRPLPNVFALLLALVACRHWLLTKTSAFIWTSAAAIIIFRFELSFFLGLLLLSDLLCERARLMDVLKHGLFAGGVCLAATVLVDSFFWKRWLWPEGEVLYYNTILNKSSNWGTLPFLWYFYSALPKSLLCAVPLSVVGLVVDKRMWTLFKPVLGFVFFYSFLAHKELRFIIYVIPMVNVIAGRGLAYVRTLFLAGMKQRSRWKLVVGAAVAGFMVCSCMVSIALTYLSHHNYPGGLAFSRLHQLAVDKKDSPVKVHIDVYTAQTGVSRFGQLYASWNYSKAEDLTVEELTEFSFLVAKAGAEETLNTHEVLEEIRGLTAFSLFKQIVRSPSSVLTPRAVILTRVRQ